MLQIEHARMAEQTMLAVLHDIMEQTVGIPSRIFRVHDEIIVETEHTPSRIELEAICTKYGVEIVPPRSAPLVRPV